MSHMVGARRMTIMLKRISTAVVAVGVCCVLAGCATGTKGSARRQCYDSGLQPGTQAFENCWQGIAARDNAQVLSTLGEVASGYAIINSAPPPSPVTNSFGRTYQLTQEWFAPSTDRMCRYENGTVLNVGTKRCAASIR